MSDRREDWRHLRLKRLFSSVVGGTWGSDPTNDAELVAPCIRGTDFDFDRLRVNLDRAPDRGFTLSEFQRRAAVSGDVIIEKSGGGQKQPVGRVVLYDGSTPVMPTNFAARLRPAALEHPQFVTYLMAGLYGAGYTRAAINQTTGIQNLDLQALLSTIVSVPPLSGQQTIADFLDAETARIDALIAKKRRLIELLIEKWTMLLRVSVLRELDPVTGLGEVPPGWSVMNLGVLIELQRGHDLPSHMRNEGAVPVISSGGPSGRHDAAVAVGPGVVTGRYGTVGEVFYVDGPYWPLNTTLYVRYFRGCHPRWVYHLLAALPLEIDSAKSAVTGINRNVIGVLRSPRPPLMEQVKIADSLDAEHARLVSLQSLLTRQIDLLTERRQALITAAVTGNLDIAHNVTEEAS